MKHNKINWGLSIIAIATLASFMWTMWNDIEEDTFTYGKDFNEVRDSLGISKIEEDWITHENNDWRRQWGHPGRRVNTIHPMHLSKTSNFQGDTLISEEDRYHYETDDSLAFRVVYRYQFDNTIWDCKFIKYRKKKYPPTVSLTLTLEQADSILNTWGLSR